MHHQCVIEFTLKYDTILYERVLNDLLNALPVLWVPDRPMIIHMNVDIESIKDTNGYLVTLNKVDCWGYGIQSMTNRDIKFSWTLIDSDEMFGADN